MTDAELIDTIHAMGAGDRSALARFAAEVAPSMLGALLRLSGSSVAARVLLEEALGTLWAQAPLYDDFLGRPREWALYVAWEIGRAHEARRVGRKKARPHRDVSPDPERRGTGPRAEAFAFLPSDQQAILRATWAAPLPGGTAGVEPRAALVEALRAWSDVLRERGLLPALPRRGAEA